MATLEELRESLPEAARDLKIGLQTVLGAESLAPQQRWGVALFSRSKTGLKPTEAALALAPLADAMAAQALAMGGWQKGGVARNCTPPCA